MWRCCYKNDQLSKELYTEGKEEELRERYSNAIILYTRAIKVCATDVYKIKYYRARAYCYQRTFEHRLSHDDSEKANTISRKYSFLLP